MHGNTIGEGGRGATQINWAYKHRPNESREGVAAAWRPRTSITMRWLRFPSFRLATVEPGRVTCKNEETTQVTRDAGQFVRVWPTDLKT